MNDRDFAGENERGRPEEAWKAGGEVPGFVRRRTGVGKAEERHGESREKERRHKRPRFAADGWHKRGDKSRRIGEAETPGSRKGEAQSFAQRAESAQRRKAPGRDIVV